MTKISLRAARINAGLTQGDAAKKLCVSALSISNWEKGKTSPKIGIFKKMCEIYGVSADDIFLPDEFSETKQ